MVNVEHKYLWGDGGMPHDAAKFVEIAAVKLKIKL